MNNIVSVEWLRKHIQDKDIVVVDCQFDLSDKESGYVSYLQGHIPRARYADLEKDLSGPVKDHGGRHPLPSKDQIQTVFEKLGIDEHSKVVAYDRQMGAMASRLWWLLGYAGHKERAVLDGGIKAWEDAGLPLEQNETEVERSHYPISLDDSMIVSMEEVKEAISKGTTIIDSRAKDRYLGQNEPIDAKAGHIPSATNLFWKDHVNNDHTWKDKESRGGVTNRGDSPIIYCGSGVTACVNVLAFHDAGINAKLYPGSFSDWISYEDNPIKP
ncbi:sulfurtransferase [Guptibacillus algicola]|uniref:sulfurtransferase n=1 Tax=Guptibacillus algicola TaxID=225844 RepID=UPI001CD3A8E5|nr:sulfurtransferase [Alkalihalobacillus algicola]MCA0988181.1 sulfurtransferase [Alkalihalobacillus algicola]